MVEMEDSGELIPGCLTQVAVGMRILTDSDKVKARRREKLMEVLTKHPHACLTCAQHEGCPRTQCSSKVPENERCCPQLGNCELQRVADYVGIDPATPKWLPTGIPILDSEPLFVRNYDLCIACTRCVRACRDLRGIDAVGFVFDANGEVKIGSAAPTLKDSACKFCTVCVEACPTGALLDRDLKNKAHDLLPCAAACPVEIDIPWYLRLVAEGNADQALSVIREKVPFPGILSRVCVRPCESVCRRGQVNEPISICAVKRFAADAGQGSWKSRSMQLPDTGRLGAATDDRVGLGRPARGPMAGKDGSTQTRSAGDRCGRTDIGSSDEAGSDEMSSRLEKNSNRCNTGKTVAVIGSGPAGLAAAFYLRKKGHGVTVFDNSPKPGGMMRYGIPRYRLPDEILDKEIGEILALGVEFRPNTQVGKDINAARLKDEFDATFIATGAPLSHKISLDGLGLAQVLWGVVFLRDVNEGKEVSVGDKVVVIGGGAVAIDVALTARRIGAKEVHLVCLEDRHEMPGGGDDDLF